VETGNHFLLLAILVCITSLKSQNCGPGKARAELEELLLESVASQQEAARLCAAQWAARLFPLSHVPSRYVCVMAAGDAKLEVREAANAGLQAPSTPISGRFS
jgi:proteasome component ECM29